MNKIVTKEDLFEIRDAQIWLKPFLTFEERIVATVQNSPEETLKMLEDNFVMFRNKVQGVFDKINDTQNKGSFLVQLQNFKKQISEINAVGDLEALYQAIETVEEEISTSIQNNRVRNLEIKTALLEEAKIVSESTNWKKASDELNDIRLRWKKTGAVMPEETERLESLLKNYIDHFYKSREAFFGNVEETIDAYKALIALSGEIVKKEVKNRQDLVKELKNVQLEWKKLPSIPKNRYSELYTQLNKVHDTFFSEYKSEFEKQREENKIKREQQSLEEKKVLVSKAKDLHTQTEGAHIMESIKELRKQWKNSGYLPDEKSEALWAEFNYWIEKRIEILRLDRMVKNTGSESKMDKKEVISQKLKHLKRLVRKEKEELEKINSNIGTFRINHKSTGFGNVLDSKAREQERKWQVKKDLIRELEAELS